MNVVFRVDASLEIGTGHVIRCVTLAEELTSKGYTCVFICRKCQGDLCEYIQDKGFIVYPLPLIKERVKTYPEEKLNDYEHWLGTSIQNDLSQTISILKKLQTVDYLIIDHYAIDNRWENNCKDFVNKIFVIDDLANRKHECHFLLDQNYYEGMELRYEGLVLKKCIKFLGPKYVLLRKEFIEAKDNIKRRNGKLRRVLVFFGGSDLTNETIRALKAFQKIDVSDIEVDVIVGNNNPYKEEIRTVCKENAYFKYHCQVDNMAMFMLRADLAVGSGGSTTWERCYLGVPSLVWTIAENQYEIANALHNQGAILFLGRKEDVTLGDIIKNMKYLVENKHLLSSMEKRCLEMMETRIHISDILTQSTHF